MKRFIPLLIAVLLIAFAGFRLQAQLYNYTDDMLGTPSFTAANLTGANLDRFKCDTTVLCGSGFMSDKFSKNDSFTVNRPSINVTLTPDFGYSITATSMSVDVRRNLKGPSLARLAYSDDAGVTWVTNGADISLEFANCDVMTTLSWDIPDFTTSNAVVFRVILYGASGSGGKLQLKNFVIDGETTALDNDGDGYGFDLDCDDTDPDINPGATEICNAIDDNCDGNIDEGIDLSIAISPDGVIELCKPDDITLTATAGFDSYQWYKNGSPLAGETGDSYTTDKPAYYQVEGFMGECNSGLSAVQAVAVYESPNSNIFTPDGLDLCADSPLLIKVNYDAASTYQWYLDGNPLTDSTDYRIFTNTLGDYYCDVTLGVCTRSSDVVTVFDGCRIGEMADEISVYPNPAKSEFTISLVSSDLKNRTATIQIADITGRIIYSNTEFISNGLMQSSVVLTESTPAGIYFISIAADDSKWNERITIIK